MAVVATCGTRDPQEAAAGDLVGVRAREAREGHDRREFVRHGAQGRCARGPRDDDNACVAGDDKSGERHTLCARAWRKPAGSARVRLTPAAPPRAVPDVDRALFVFRLKGASSPHGVHGAPACGVTPSPSAARAQRWPCPVRWRRR